ncbi:MAG: hypothetical protein BMS9Abin37_0456 [Acidobacteriota bacterium]|nr:MAG: hypothetical protein BMS9Abin37_0456 [Acidobacteriota bacterium]
MSFLHINDDDSTLGVGKSVALALIVLMCIGGAVYWFFSRAPESEPVPEATPPPAKKEAPPPAPPKSRADLPSTGSLTVTADLDGASVYVNGISVGTAPYEDADIRVGSHEVKVTKDGYVDYVEIVRIRPGKSAKLRVSLALLPPSLRIVSDVPGATVFLDRNYIGTTPVDIKAVEAGEHQLTVSADGYDMHTETVAVTTGHRDIRVSFEQAASELNESVSVIHKHSFGKCSGTLIADSAGIRYQSDHKDAFAIPYASLERFEVDYIKKNMNLKVRKGKNYNFTEQSGDADALFVFHKNVQAFLERMQ